MSHLSQEVADEVLRRMRDVGIVAVPLDFVEVAKRVVKEFNELPNLEQLPESLRTELRNLSNFASPYQ